MKAALFVFNLKPSDSEHHLFFQIGFGLASFKRREVDCQFVNLQPMHLMIEPWSKISGQLEKGKSKVLLITGFMIK